MWEKLNNEKSKNIETYENIATKEMNDNTENTENCQSLDISLFEGKFEKGKLTQLKEILCKIKNIIFNLRNFTYFLFILSIILYFMSLQGCYKSFQQCQDLAKNTRFYINLGIILVFSCAIFSLSFLIQIVSDLPKYNYIIFLLPYILIFFFTQGTDFAHHGTYNFFCFVFLFPVFLAIYFYIYKILFYCYNRERKKWSIILTITLLIILYINHSTNCNHYYDGLGSEKIINDPLYDSCEFQLPYRCGFKYFSGVFDFSVFKRDCLDINDKKVHFLKHLNKSLEKYNTFYYPRTEHWPPRNTYNNLHDYVLDAISYEYDKDNEVSINFENNIGKVDIYLKKNETLVKERKKIAELNPVKYDNVYIIYLDAISRNHFQRKLKKSSKLIEQLLYSNKINKINNNINPTDESIKNFNSFQFFKYYNFNGFTRGNNMPFIYGSSENAFTGISMTKFYKEKGFITCMTHNSCNKEIFDWEDYFYREFEFSDWDHENVALFCDTNYEDKANKWKMVYGKTSIYRKCFYGKDSFEYNFEYVNQFLEAYKNERKFFKLMIVDGHEMTMEVIKFIDDSLTKFILNILNNYSTDKTAIMIMSDHGSHMPFIYDAILYEEKNFEVHMGSFFLILSGNNTNILENLYYNQQKFLTPYDLHDTLLDMINVNKFLYPQMDNNKGQSLFEKINGKERNCGAFHEEIMGDCFCKKY